MTTTTPSTPSHRMKPVLTGTQVFAILLIPAVWLIDSTIMAPALGLIAQANPHASSFWINIVFTIPYPTAIIFSSLSGRLSRRIDKRTLVVTGLVIYGVSGIIPAFTGTLLVIFFLRLVTGIGLGLALPIPNIYIADQYSAEKREKMLGYASVVAQAANITVLLVAGQLISIGWRDTFYEYAFILIIAVVSLWWLPKSPQPRGEEPAVAATAAPWTRGEVLAVAGLAVSMTAVFICFTIAAANISPIVVTYKLAAVSSLGYLGIAPAAGVIIGSFLSERLRVLLRAWLVPLALVLMGAGFLAFSVVSGWLGVEVSTGIVGVATGLLTPFILNLTTLRVSPDHKGLALGIVSGSIDFGILLFPYVQQLIGYLAKDTDLKFLFTVVGVITFIAAAVAVVVIVARHATAWARRSASAAMVPSAAFERQL